MAVFALTQLVSWTRRTSGDRVIPTIERLSSDGTTIVTLNNEGDIIIESVVVDAEEVSDADYTLTGNLLVFGDEQVEGAEVIVTYSLSNYTNLQILDYLRDAAIVVAGDLHAQWDVIDDDGWVIDDGSDEWFIDGVKSDPIVETLVVLRASINISNDRAMTAATDAIMVKDGDTTIDTSKGANSTEKVMTRLSSEYDSYRKRAASGRFRGHFSLR